MARTRTREQRLALTEGDRVAEFTYSPRASLIDRLEKLGAAMDRYYEARGSTPRRYTPGELMALLLTDALVLAEVSWGLEELRASKAPFPCLASGPTVVLDPPSPRSRQAPAPRS